jgi:hypothetical protein
LHSGTETVSRAEKEELVNDQKHGGKSGSDGRGSESQQGSGVGSGVYGKARYVEMGSRSSRGGRGGPPTGAMPTAQDLQQSQGDLKSDTAGTDGNLHSGRQSKEDEEPDALLPQPSVTEDRKKQEGPYWHEQGGGHRQGGRHERNGQGPKEGALAISGAELATKPSKRGRAPPVLGANEVCQ